MDTDKFVQLAFGLAQSNHTERHKRWIAMSHKVGGRLPKTALMMNIQYLGSLDLLLWDQEILRKDRVKNDELDFGFHYQCLLSNLWIGSAYEIFRLLKSRDIIASKVFRDIEYDLKLLRIPMEKLEIASDKKFKTVTLRAQPERENDADYVYESADPQRGYMMPSALSDTGSICWQPIDALNGGQRWLSRADLSNQILECWEALEPVSARS